MKKYSFTILAALLSALVVINITCKKDDDNESPTTPPVYTDGQGEVGKIGGTVKIEDSGSPLDGSFVEIPEGALSSTKDISISINTSDVLIMDSSAIIVEFTPGGLSFDEPVNVGIPYPKGEDSGNNLKVYYYEPDDEKLVEMPILNYNNGDRIITFSTNHFSNFASTARFTDIFVNMVQVDGTIGALVEINSKYYGEQRRLRNVYTLPPVAIETGFSNCQDIINYHSGQKILSIFNITLKRKIALWADETIQSKKMIVKRIENNTGSHGYQIYQDYVSQSNLLYEKDPGENELILETFMQGIPLIFKFDKNNFEPNPDHDYYVNIEWAMATQESAVYASRYSHLYDENNRDEAKEPGEMSNWNFDVDPVDNVNDNYQGGGGGNQPPIDPHSPTPDHEATNVSINPTLSWECSDPDGDDLDYDIYFGTSSNPPLAEEYYTSTSWNPGTLYENTTYYWYIKAFEVGNDDHYSQGDVWEFTTGQSGGGGTGEPCPGLETITYGGQVYNTVIIGNQCWLKENLNYEAGNSWCYDNDPSNCDTYGRLYDWETALTVCPSGWHLPSDEEWKILEGTVDSQYDHPDPEWNGTFLRGFDAGLNLKSTSGWYNNGNGTNLYGFNALPGGCRHNGSFIDLGLEGNWWSSSEHSGSFAWTRNLRHGYDGSYRIYIYQPYGRSVRCLKDGQLPTLITTTITNITQATATGGGNVTDDGGADVTARGVCWSTSQNPDINDDHTSDGSGTGTFTSQLTGLNESTTYYVRAYATNIEGTTYGNQMNFTTQSGSGGGEPCPGLETITYGGQVYNTVLIGNQCWLAENLNVGEMIPGDEDPEDNGTIEKYCYDNSPARCETYGGLYQWPEVMQYVNQQGTQGICPDGWHIPTDNEWKTLEGTVDSQYPAGDPEWDDYSWRGLDAGKNLKSIYGWKNNGNGTDLYGFSAQPGGYLWIDTWTRSFRDLIETGTWWSSSGSSFGKAKIRLLSYNNDGSYRSTTRSGRSVRCLKD